MREYTQSVTGLRGNCWQTAVACVLEVDPAGLPPQCEYDWKRPLPDGTTEYGPGYNNALQAYLRTHHGLAYVELHCPYETYGLLRVAPGTVHLMTGRTVRSADLGGLRHVVVGRDGVVVWDPHPSRAGLLDQVAWAFLMPYPAQWAAHAARAPLPCVCPACAGGSAASP